MKILYISDVHIGHKNSKCFTCLTSIDLISPNKIYLNGDIIDIHAIVKSREYWHKHKSVIKKFLELIKNKKIKVVYIVGNHDWHLLLLAPISWMWDVRIKIWHSTKTKMIEHGWLIPPLLKIKKFFRRINPRLDGGYLRQRMVYAQLLQKNLIVGHTHKPEIISVGKVSVYDSGDWVEGHNSYLLEEDDVITLVSY